MKRLLVVVDYQNDFVDGTLGFPGAEKLDERIAAKIADYEQQCDVIVFTMDTHQPDYLKTQEGRNLPVEHCIEGTDGWNLYGKTAESFKRKYQVFRKPTFGSYQLAEYLHEAQEAAGKVGKLPFESIELVGLVSNICVLSNAVVAKAACPEVPIIVDASCTASFDAAMNEKCLDVLEGLQVDVINR